MVDRQPPDSPASSGSAATAQPDPTPTRKTVKTIHCFLCGGVQIYPGPRYENHLINEHGVLDIDFMINLSLYKEKHGANPDLDVEPVKLDPVKSEPPSNVVKKDEQSTISEKKELSTQTDEDGEMLCVKCGTNEGVKFRTRPQLADDDDDVDEEEEEDEEQRYAAAIAMQEEMSDNELKIDLNDENDHDGAPRSTFNLSEEKRKPVGKEWGPNSFSSTFTCYFCNESFRKDYKLKLHLMLNHKNEDPEEMAKAKEVLTKSKLDGCIHRCAMCGSKYNSVANFTRHIKDVHQITRAEYREQYGCSEVVSRTFKCELCDKEVKHTRNIIGAHMKMVHLISWKEYQEILVKLRQGVKVGDLPAPELFDCIICGVSVKYRREHLNKKHQITEEVYDELIAKKNRGEDINEVLPEREIYRCLICKRECMDLKKHLDRSHQITEEIYEEMTGGKIDEAKWAVKQVQPASPSIPRIPPKTPKPFRNGRTSPITVTPTIATSSANNATMLSTDLRCYFGCDEIFKKDYQLHLHLKLRHRDEDPDDLKRAYEAADEEIALTKRSGSTFQCALCPKTFTDNGAFYGHIQSKHNMQWKDYKDKFGRCEVESAPFECKICGRVVKYDRNTVHTHLKNVHGITWAIYLDRIRKMRRGEALDELPNIETHECRVCNVSVKYIREHLKNVHKITESEYEELFKNEDDDISKPTKKVQVQTPQPDYLATDINLPKPPKSDIQDKTNKKCSSCSITFDSRRSFIEHCTTVHNMKFRTKSGATISAPSIQQKQQQEMKRKQEEQMNQEFKRPRFELDNAEVDSFQSRSLGSGNQSSRPIQSGIIGTNGNRKTLYTPAGVSKWNQCVYECCFCKRTTMSRSSMTSHIHNTHGIQIKDYKEANYPDIEVETNWFQCRLCPARTKFVKDCIAPHLKMSHSMDIETYEREVMQPEDWPYQVVSHPPTPNHNGFKMNNGAAARSSPPAIVCNPGSSSSGDVEGGDKWNRCKYQCCLCDLITLDHRQIRIHIATQHGMQYNEYVRQYGTTEIVSKKFHCDLCKSVMKFCRQNIYAHLKDVHKMTLDDYEAKVGMGRNGEFDGDEMEAENSVMGDNGSGEIMLHGEAQVGAVHGVGGAKSVLDEGRRPSRWNKCRFKCVICNKLSSEKRHVREHIVKVHGLTLQEYEGRYGSCEIHTEYFFCGICHAEVKHNLKNISLHLQNSHSMTSSQYEEQYGRLPEQEPLSDHDSTPASANQQVEDYGFGGHFMLDEDDQDHYMEVSLTTPPVHTPAQPERANPSKADVQNPKNKFCVPCNRDFTRRQTFLDHCRNIHKMNIKVAGSQTPRASPSASTFKCDYCPKSFSSRSNKNRHMLLSCEVAGPNARNAKAGGGGEGYVEDSSPVPRKERVNSGDYIYDPQISRATSKESIELRCNQEGCDETFARSALMKRHLIGVHNVSETLTPDKRPAVPATPQRATIKEEPLDEPKVPPLRVELSSPVVKSEGAEEGREHVDEPIEESAEANGAQDSRGGEEEVVAENQDGHEEVPAEGAAIPVEATLEEGDAEELDLKEPEDEPKDTAEIDH